MAVNYLREVLESVQHPEQVIEIHNTDDEAAAERVADYFEPFNVDVFHRTTADEQPPDTVVLSEDGAVTAISDLSQVDEYLTSFRLDDVADERVPSILNSIDTRTFTSMSVRRMVLASREVETMAHRVGEGSVHAGFQQLSRAREQAAVYRRLLDSGLDVHLYGAERGEAVPPRLSSLLASATVICERTPELAESWFVFFTAEETTAGMFAVATGGEGRQRFHGCWSYDEAQVEAILDHLRSRYERPVVPG